METDTWLGILKAHATLGGAHFKAIAHNTGGGSVGPAFLFDGGATSDTTKTTAGRGIFEVNGYEQSVTGGATMTANGNIVAFRQNGNARFIFDAEGSGHADVEWVAFDEHDDLALMRTFQDGAVGRLTPGRYGINPLAYNRAYFEEVGIVGQNSWHTEAGHQRQMVNFTRLAMLHHGGILQLADSQQDLGARITQLEAENRELRQLVGAI